MIIFEQMDLKYSIIQRIRLIAMMSSRRAPLMIQTESRMNVMWKKITCGVLIFLDEPRDIRRAWNSRCLMVISEIGVSWILMDISFCGTQRASFKDNSFGEHSMGNESRAGKQHGGMNGFA